MNLHVLRFFAFGVVLLGFKNENPYNRIEIVS